MRTITFASQQGTPWTGFNGYRGFGQGTTQATMLDGTIATAQQDSAGNVVGFYALLPDGSTMTYDASGAPAGATAAPSGLAAFFASLSQTLSGLLGGSTAGGPTAAWTMNPSTWGVGTYLMIGAGVYLLSPSGGGGGSRRRNPRRRRHMSAHDRARFQQWVYGTQRRPTRRRPVRPY